MKNSFYLLKQRQKLAQLGLKNTDFFLIEKYHSLFPSG